MTKDQLYSLFLKFRDGSITGEELRILKLFISADSGNAWLRELIENFNDEESAEFLSDTDSDALFDKILVSVRDEKKLARPIKYINKIVILTGAIAAILLLCFSLFFPGEFNNDDKVVLAEVVPGRPKGNLLLENGEIINLDQVQSDTSIVLNGYTITVLKNGELKYTLSTNQNSNTPIYNTIVTPKGGEYTLSLPDGTKIWVNSSSKIRYPLNFGHSKREVELEGEALFEVASLKFNNSYIPFIVKTGDQNLEVLGTTFNINSYGKVISTTLVEGAVRLSFGDENQQLLKPNQQANYSSSHKKVTIKEIDPFYTIAWRNGVFAFDEMSIENVMEVLARWYDIEIEYQRDIKNIKFTGSISKYEDIGEVLEIMELTKDVKFKLIGRRVIVM